MTIPKKNKAELMARISELEAQICAVGCKTSRAKGENLWFQWLLRLEREAEIFLKEIEE